MIWDLGPFLNVLQFFLHYIIPDEKRHLYYLLPLYTEIESD